MTAELDECTHDAVKEAGGEAYFRSPHIPLIRAKVPALRMLRTLPEECVVLSTKQRVPYMLFVEVRLGAPKDERSRNPCLEDTSS